MRRFIPGHTYGFEWITHRAERGGRIVETARAITVGTHHRRKSVVLFVQDGTTLRSAAYFRSEEEANRFLDALEELAGLRLSPKEVHV